MYRFDPILGSLKAETTAGKLYLSLLYYKTASLNRDSYTGLNGYENAMSILDSCWQNSSYDEVELSIVNKILLFKDEQFQTKMELKYLSILIKSLLSFLIAIEIPHVFG